MNQTQQSGTAIKKGEPLLVLKSSISASVRLTRSKLSIWNLTRGRSTRSSERMARANPTLVELLTGVHERSSGEVYWEGKPVTLAIPHEAIDHGINAVHQEVVLCPHLTVASNIFLGDEKVRFGIPNSAKWFERVKKFSMISASSYRQRRCSPG